MDKLVTVKIGGEAGFGIKVAGSTLGTVFSRMGYEVFDHTEYPSLIRGGHNTFEITIGQKVFSHVRPVNLLIALNQQTFDSHLSELSSNAGIIFDPVKTKKTSEKFRLFPVPLTDILKQTGGSDLMKNTVALGAALAVLCNNEDIFIQVLKETFAKKLPAVIQQNIAAASGGFNYVKEHFKDKFDYHLESKEKKHQIYLTGNEAVGLGAIAGGCTAYFGYPMTPSSPLLAFMAKHGPKHRVLVRQPEDEISVLNTAIGAGWAGVRSMVATAGGGFSLMTEALGLSGITETPVVIYVGQRPGPATGLPTWSSQADLRFLMHASQDEFPRIIIAPGDHEEAFYETTRAFNLAEKYQMPVFILFDKNLGEGGKTVPPFDQSKVKIERGEWVSEADIKKLGRYLRYKVTESGISSRVLPGTEGGVHISNSDEHDEYGYNVEDVENRNAQMEKRMRKLQTAMKEVPEPKLYGPKDADLTIVSWGSTKGPILQALNLPSPGARLDSTRQVGRVPEGREGSLSVNFLHFVYLWPFPTPKAVELIKSAKRLMTIENNYTGQFDGLIRQFIGRAPEESLRKYDGRPFWPHEIVEAVSKIVSK